MKKRIVAIMLSLTMCLSMAAEASAASEADFTAETAAADVSDVAVFDDAEAENPSDNTADVDSEEAASDDVQIDMGADEDANAEAVDITDERSRMLMHSVQKVKKLKFRLKGRM